MNTGIISKAVAADTSAITLKINTGSYDLGQLVGVITNWVAIIAGIIAFFFLVYSGFTYLTAGGNAEQAKKGGQGIINAVIGIIVIALSWALVSALAGQFRA